MFSMNINHEVKSRYVQFDGMVHYYKNGWLSNKWVVVYAKLWSDSTLEWFTSKGSTSPVGSIVLSTLIPYICIGPQIRKIRTKKPKIEATWTRDLLMAIATDQKASSVHWFYFDNGSNLRKWISEITQTLPRLNSTAAYPRQNAVGGYQNDVIGGGYNRDYQMPSMPMTRPYDAPRMDIGSGIAPRMDIGDGTSRAPQIHMSVHSSSQHPQQRRSSFDDLFDETFQNYGLGNFFFPMEFNDSSSSDSSDSDDDIRHHNNGVHVFGDDNVHVTKLGDSTVTIRTGNDHGMSHPHQNDSGFTKVHHFDLN